MSVYLGAISALSRPQLLRRFIRSAQLQLGLGIPFSRGQASRAACFARPCAFAATRRGGGAAICAALE